MMNPASLMKMAALGKRFEGNHPKFAAFFRTIMSQGMTEGTVIEVKITRPDGTSLVSNMKVTPDDMDLVNEIKNLNVQ